MSKRSALGTGIKCDIPAVENYESIEVRDAAGVLLSLNGNDKWEKMDWSMIAPDSELPAKDFEEEELQELAESIKKYGLLSPIIVQERDGRYVIIAGERRWRAAQIAGLTEIPVIIRNYAERERTVIGIIRDMTKKALPPKEEYYSYRRLIDEFGLSIEEISEKLSEDIEYLQSLGLK